MTMDLLFEVRTIVLKYLSLLQVENVHCICIQFNQKFIGFVRLCETWTKQLFSLFYFDGWLEIFVSSSLNLEENQSDG